MKEVLHLLEAERETERQFVVESAIEPDFPGGWSAALLMAHIAAWRGRLRDCLIQASRGEPVSGPPDDVDAVNAAQLTRDARIPLQEAAARAETMLGDLIDLCATLGDRPFSWFTAKTTAEALARNSYIHPRRHLSEHYVERGDRSRGAQIHEETIAELRRADAPESVLNVWK